MASSLGGGGRLMLLKGCKTMLTLRSQHDVLANNLGEAIPSIIL